MFSIDVAWLLVIDHGDHNVLPVSLLKMHERDDIR